jgi:hypothetical protein
VNGGGEGGNAKIDWPLVISIAALLFGVVQFVGQINDDSEGKAVAMEKRISTNEAENDETRHRVEVIECQMGMTCNRGR